MVHDIWQPEEKKVRRKERAQWQKDVLALARHPEWESLEKYCAARGRKAASLLYRGPMSGREADVGKLVGLMEAWSEIANLAETLKQEA